MSFTPHERRRWDVLVDRAELGDPLSDEERAFIEAGADADPSLRAELDGWDRMVDLLAQEVGGELVDAEQAGLAAQVLAAHRHRQDPGLGSSGRSTGRPTDQAPSPRQDRRGHRPRRGLLAAGGVAALAAAAALLLALRPGLERAATPAIESTQADVSSGPHRAIEPAPEALPPAAAPRIAMLQGGGAAGSALASDMAFGPGCLVYDEPWVVACTDGRVVRREAEDGGRVQVLELREGAVQVTLDHLHEGRHFVVDAGATRVTAVGTTFAVELAPEDADPGAPEVTTSVLEGVVEITYGADAVRRVAAGQAHFSGDVVSAELEPIAVARQEALASHRSLAELWRAEPSDWGYVALEQDPAALEDSMAIVDGHHVGTGSLTLALASGPHAVSSDGRSERIELSPGETATVSLRARAERAASGPERKTPRRNARAKKSAASAASLLSDARAARKSGDFAEAAALYESLLQTHPDAPEARPVRVQLGDLRLSKLDDPAGALEAYRTYLAAGGVMPLAPEARYGVVRSLRKLGRHGDERAAIEAFLRAHPADWRGEELRRRVDELPRE